MLIFEYMQTSYHYLTEILHTHNNTYTHLTQHAPVYTTIATTIMTHSIRYYIQRMSTLHVVEGGAFCVYVQ